MFEKIIDKFKPPRKLEEPERGLFTSFVAGAVAGLVVDVTLFPLDTLKTRLQSQYGFWKSGGFKGIYKGVGPTAVGSAPCAALFFVTYNEIKNNIQPLVKSNEEFIVQMFAAAAGEAVSCAVRVPTEIIKQRRQACIGGGTAWFITKEILKQRGVFGMYQGFWTTILRDVPYAVIQFPLWELFKTQLRHRHRKEPSPIEGAICGAVAGSVAGALTTPLDVIKTRIMLSVECSTSSRKVSSQVSVRKIVKNIYKQAGVFGFFAGFAPRVLWIFLGGGVFFGVYEEMCVLIDEK